MSGVVAWLVLAALFLGAPWLAGKVAGRGERKRVFHESHRDRYGRPLPWRPTTAEAELLEQLERDWKRPSVNHPKEDA